MNISKKPAAGLLAMLTALAVLSSGCGMFGKNKPRAWNLEITKRTPASIQVDVVGVTEREKGEYDKLSMANYWPNSQVRKDTEKDRLSAVLKINETWTVALDNPKWQEWKDRGVTHVMILADLPVSDGEWKVALSLAKSAWEPTKKNTLELDIYDSRIKVLTKEKPRD